MLFASLWLIEKQNKTKVVLAEKMDSHMNSTLKFIMKSYILPLVFFIAMMALTYLFIELNVIEDNEKRLTLIVTFLGLGFGVFQFFVTEINNQKRFEFNLKYEAYKELRNIIDLVFHTLNHEMITAESNPHGIASKVIILVNQYKSSVEFSSDVFFEGLTEREEAIKVKDTLTKILDRANRLRIQIDNIHKKRSPDTMDEIAKVVEQMNWHNDTIQCLKDLNKHKFPFYRAIRSYF
ncbi:hypothetical protein [Catalinimonas niigatensis]|uniref:hypothetical protein n=1 Tax=Catalinimonas niigatensis TaxID=1397264 RepID=UPI002666315E|nr:hypothetical protein [Catalinimonas niigatensis]WPP52166.1 hypothetical protein PZB72_07210 [Catalinimonas niigatensis]